VVVTEAARPRATVRASLEDLVRTLRLFLVCFAVAASGPLAAIDQSDSPGSAEAEGWPRFFPVVECGTESKTVFVEADPAVLAKNASGTKVSPIISNGTRRIIYSIVDMENVAHPQSQAETDHTMELIEAYWERISHGRLDIELTAAGRVSIPFRNDGSCDYQEWARAVDDVVGQTLDLYQYDGRVYFLPGIGSCGVGGRGTLDGNPELPIYTGGFANQSWVMIPDAEFIVAHEMGHNFGLRHGRTPSSTQGPGEEYGDRSTLMGDYNRGFSSYLRELRGLHGVNRAKLGWLTPWTEMKPGIYTIYASELEQAPGLQALAIPHPWSYAGQYPDGFFLTYRNGSDGLMADGTFAPLLPEYTRGVGVRLAKLSASTATYLFRVLRDGESFFFTDPDHDRHSFFSVRQISHDIDKVTFELSFHPRPNEESITADTCNNGIDDDGDWRMDFGGGYDWSSGLWREPEGPACMMTWESIVAPPTVDIFSEFFVVCQSEFARAEGMGPQGTGLVDTTRESNGRYVGRFKAVECGEYSFTCGAMSPDAFIRDHLETTVEVACRHGRFCDQGRCVAFPGLPRSQDLE
jgi:hypothetical protein